MGLLDKLWDDTLAGPRPETGLGRLRKPAPFSFRSNSGKEEMGDSATARSLEAESSANVPRVTRSIMIKRPTGCPSPVSGTPPASPAESTPPASPFSGGKECNRLRRYSSSDAYEQRVGEALAKSPSARFGV
ncbi:hypothetical protein HPP92_011851 [Vanilla planifolia]|uniref:Uncharacterized protein n=1 Tax=Vanilla planifolia TaxID=51239 RepID=A0A835R6V5_VANPL|nr:hypothetical protein HPP92_011851 [Vanilla planifolia]